MGMPLDSLLGKWSTPLALATAIFGGAAWLTTIRSDVMHLQQEIEDVNSYIRESRLQESNQDDRLSRIETKLDLIVEYIKTGRRYGGPFK